MEARGYEGSKRIKRKRENGRIGGDSVDDAASQGTSREGQQQPLIREPRVAAANRFESGAEDQLCNKSETPKKRRKVSQACLYCRRSHMTCDSNRPCNRCKLRKIGHLCRDEPCEPPDGKMMTGNNSIAASSSATTSSVGGGGGGDTRGHGLSADGNEGHGQLQHHGNSRRPSIQQRQRSPVGPPPAIDVHSGGSNEESARPPGQSADLNMVLQGTGGGGGVKDDPYAWHVAQHSNPYLDMTELQGGYMFATEAEAATEFSFLNEFLQQSTMFNQPAAAAAAAAAAALPQLGESRNAAAAQQTNGPEMMPFTSVNRPASSLGQVPPSTADKAAAARLNQQPPDPESAAAASKSGVSAAVHPDKARDYYFQAADPSGDDTPEERMQRLLRAKYDAGLLRPFNYVNGYQRLGAYLEGPNVAVASRQRILRALDRFRPKFREKVQALTDIELIYVEMWFERQLMEYDRVFAAIAVPACCWRRTGEIYRANKEMAELIDVPVERLREGKISLHEILTEDSLVRYWEEFGTIAFDALHHTLLTACELKHPDAKKKMVVKCAFSFMIRHDEHTIPTLVIGNFLPHDPVPP